MRDPYPERQIGRTFVVTGASRGMGAAHCERLAAEGANLVLTDVADDAGEALAERLSAGGGDVVYVGADVARAEDWDRVRDTAVSTFGAVHGLVNNAGIVSNKKIATIDRSTWENVMSVNLTGAFLGMKTFAPVIRDSGGGSIVNVSSAAGISVHPDPAYAGSKWALRGLTKVGAMEFSDWGVRVNSIHPGYFDTPMNDFASDTLREAKLAVMPLGRPGEAWEAAALVSFLLSEESAFITGSEITIDGGFTAGSQCKESKRSLRQDQ